MNALSSSLVFVDRLFVHVCLFCFYYLLDFLFMFVCFAFIIYWTFCSCLSVLLLFFTG